MALVKTIIKNDPREVIVKWTGSGSDTLTLSSLISTNQTLLGSPVPGVIICGATASLDSSGICTVTRNSVEALHVNGNFELSQSGSTLYTLSENSGFDIVVNLATLGTLILRLKKTQGYSAF